MTVRAPMIGRVLAIVASLCLCVAVFSPSAKAASASRDFATWLQAFQKEAVSKGISPATVTAAFDGVEPIARILELDQRQPEFSLSLLRYLNNAVPPERVKRGRELLTRHRPLLEKIRRHYGIQPRFLVAFWGLETNFGEYAGGFPVIGALATLAHDKRRGAFFREQLYYALKMIDEGHVTAKTMTGSWAGGMGPLQFIPSTFDQYALDYDGDGRRDIWRSLPDIFASAANFLHARRWQANQTWGREVRLPADFDWALAGLHIEKQVGDWQALGIRRAEGWDLPPDNHLASIVLPAGHKGPAFMVHRNFRAIMAWNRSIYYALALGHLSDRIAGKGRLVSSGQYDDEWLSRAEVSEMQSLLTALGYYASTPDGIAGRETRLAVKTFQNRQGFPADGFPTKEVLQHLRETAAR